MKLTYRITFRLSIALLLLLTVWAFVFYHMIMSEIDDETDDALQRHSGRIISSFLSGETMPCMAGGANNTYYLEEVDREYASRNPMTRFSDENVFIWAQNETEPARVLKTIFKDRDNRYYELTVMIPMVEKEELRRTILALIFILYVLLLLSILAANTFILKRSMRPLYSMLKWLDTYTLDNRPPLRMRTDITEFRKLSDSLERNAERNEEIYRQQSLFIGHASHELQTPIAVAKNRLELLAGDSTLSVRQLEHIIKARHTLDYMAKLNKTLLLLAKIENRQLWDNVELNVNDFLREMMSDYQEAYSHSGVSGSLKEEGTLILRFDKMLATVLFGNLIKNAFIHNKSGGTVKVSVGSGEVTVSNTAVSGALNPEYIYRRFYQGIRTEGSAGLGLSLVESIVKLYGMTIEYSFEEEMHIFRLRFPENIRKT